MNIAMFVISVIILAMISINNFMVIFFDSYARDFKFPFLTIALSVLAIINFAIGG